MSEEISREEAFVIAVRRDMEALDRRVKEHKEEFGFGHERISKDIEDGDLSHIGIKLHNLEELVQSFVSERTSLTMLNSIISVALSRSSKDK